MNIPEPFIRRPVMTTLVMAAILCFGALAYGKLPVSDLPNVDFPTILVSASLPGASPDTMASSVATPLEREFSTIAGLDSMTSSSSLGNTQITLQFNLDRNLDAAAQDVQAAISRVERTLPSDMPSPPSYRKVNPAASPILYLALTSPTLPLYDLDEYAETMMAEKISTVSGVAQVEVHGSQKYAVRIQLDPNALATKGIGFDTVTQAVQNANVNLPTGTLDGAHRAFTLKTEGQLKDAQAYRPLVVTYRNGHAVRLADLGRVVNSVENNKTAAYYINQRSVVLAIQRQPGTNTVAVVDAVRKLLPSFEKLLPASVSLHVLFDRSVSIRNSVSEVKFTLLIALVLVVVVIFLFLRNLRATVIPSLAMPMAIVGTFAVMYLLGYSLDNLSLMALILSVGFVVDDAIVMLENIVRHREMGKPAMQAALEGSREVGFTILSMTLSLAAVFIPMLFMGGVIGKLFHEFAVTIAAAVLISGVVSLTLTPMLCSRFLYHGKRRRHGHLYNVSEKFFSGMLGLYKLCLRPVLKYRWITILVSFSILYATYVVYEQVPKGFLPSEDQGRIFVSTQAAEDISFDAMGRHQKALAAIVAKDPNVEAFMSSYGSRGFTGSNTGVLFIHLKPRSERKLSVDQVIAELRPKFNAVPGIRAFLQNPPPIRVSGRLSKSQYQFTLQSADTNELYHYAPLLADDMQKLPGFVGVTTDLEIKNPEVVVHINRDKASTMGVDVQKIEDMLYSGFGSRQISTIFTSDNEYEVIMELEPKYQRDPSALRKLYVTSERGTLVPLDTLVTLKKTLGPLSVNHQGQLPAVTISFDLARGTSLGSAVDEVDGLARKVLPADISTNFAGSAQVFQQSMSNLGLLLVMAILVIYLVLGILYESFIHPITIFSALPFAGFGAILTLYVFHMELDLYAFVGIIMLVGLVKKNGIMMIDFALAAQREEGKSAREAIFEACVIRFRPIMMTTMAALLGTLPIAIGAGAGSESRRPLGMAVVGGLLFSQTLTLFVTPVIYTYMESFRHFVGRLFGGGRPAKEEGVAEGTAELATSAGSAGR